MSTVVVALRYSSVKAKNLCVHICMYVGLSVCPSRSTKTIHQFDFQLGRCVADVSRPCMFAFDAVWTREVFGINKNLDNLMLSASSCARRINE